MIVNICIDTDKITLIIADKQQRLIKHIHLNTDFNFELQIFPLLDSVAEQTANDGQTLLEEMSRPIKNAFGKDITPDYVQQMKRINRQLEELQERKLRCDELADVRRLKLQQLLQLRTCERDCDQVGVNLLLHLFLSCLLDSFVNVRIIVIVCYSLVRKELVLFFVIICFCWIPL